MTYKPRKTKRFRTKDLRIKVVCHDGDCCPPLTMTNDGNENGGGISNNSNTTRNIQTTTLCRMLASIMTWPVEKTKLLYQGVVVEGRGASSSSFPPTIQLRNATRQLIAIPPGQHVLGMASSAIQRGGSAFFMFTCQNKVYEWTNGLLSVGGGEKNDIVGHCFAGVLSGAVTAPFHTYWELAKVRGGLPDSWTMYRTALIPMIFRHAVFDGVFFGVSTACDQWGKDLRQQQEMSEILSHSGVKFGLAAATASLANLLFDVWKTRRMGSFPTRVNFISGVVRTMTAASFISNYLVKGTDLTVNWFVVGSLKDHLFFVDY